MLKEGEGEGKTKVLVEIGGEEEEEGRKRKRRKEGKERGLRRMEDGGKRRRVEKDGGRRVGESWRRSFCLSPDQFIGTRDANGKIDETTLEIFTRTRSKKLSNQRNKIL